MAIKKLKLEKLIIDAGTDVRSEISEATVEEYGQSARAKDKLPPLTVYDTKDGLLLADGFHRYFGFERQGIKEYECDVIKGTREDAIKFALGCNTKHGLRRSNADKRHAVLIALKEFPQLSSRAIATLCLVSNMLVDEIRKEVEEKTEREKLAEEDSAGESSFTCGSVGFADSCGLFPPTKNNAFIARVTAT